MGETEVLAVRAETGPKDQDQCQLALPTCQNEKQARGDPARADIEQPTSV